MSLTLKSIRSSDSTVYYSSDEILHVILKSSFSLKHKWNNFYITESVSKLLISSVYVDCCWFVLLFIKTNLWSLPTLLQTVTENRNLHECSRPSQFQHLKLIWIIKYFLQHCKCIFKRTKDFNVFNTTDNGIQPHLPHNYRTWGEWWVWSFVFKQHYYSCWIQRFSSH